MDDQPRAELEPLPPALNELFPRGTESVLDCCRIHS